MTSEYDPLRDEGAIYAQRLAAAGVSVTYRCYAGMIHIFQGPEAIADIGQQLRVAFASADQK